MRLKIINLETVNSTNNYAFNLAKKGVKEITVVRANSQTKGKGRFKKSWSSPKSRGVYVSFLLRPSNVLKEIGLLPLLFSLGAAKILNDITDVKIKWPNDVIVRDKKIAGVLVETQTIGQRADFVIVGIGINVNSKKGEIPLTATSLYLETKKDYNIDELARKLISEEINIYKRFKEKDIEGLTRQAAGYCDQKTIDKFLL